MRYLFTHPFILVLICFAIIFFLAWCSHLCDVQIAKIITKQNDDKIKTPHDAALSLFTALSEVDDVIGTSSRKIGNIIYLMVFIDSNITQKNLNRIPSEYMGFPVKTETMEPFYAH